MDLERGLPAHSGVEWGILGKGPALLHRSRTGTSPADPLRLQGQQRDGSLSQWTVQRAMRGSSNIPLSATQENRKCKSKRTCTCVFT